MVRHLLVNSKKIVLLPLPTSEEYLACSKCKKKFEISNQDRRRACWDICQHVYCLRCIRDMKDGCEHCLYEKIKTRAHFERKHRIFVLSSKFNLRKEEFPEIRKISVSMLPILECVTDPQGFSPDEMENENTFDNKVKLVDWEKPQGVTEGLHINGSFDDRDDEDPIIALSENDQERTFGVDYEEFVLNLEPFNKSEIIKKQPVVYVNLTLPNNGTQQSKKQNKIDNVMKLPIETGNLVLPPKKRICNREYPHPSFGCDICDWSSPHMKQLYIHRRIHKEYRLCRCQQCTATFKCKKVLDLHETMMHLRKRRKGNLAKNKQAGNKAASRSDHHRKFEKTRVFGGLRNVPDMQLQCKLCNENFVRRLGLERHYGSVHGIRTRLKPSETPQGKEYCPECQSVFKTGKCIKIAHMGCKHISCMHCVVKADEFGCGQCTTKRVIKSGKGITKMIENLGIDETKNTKAKAKTSRFWIFRGNLIANRENPKNKTTSS